MTYRMTDALTDALAEIERLRERVGELCDALSIASDHAQMLEQSDQRREQLLRDVLGWLSPDDCPMERKLAGRIRAELGMLSQDERDGIVAEYEAGDL